MDEMEKLEQAYKHIEKLRQGLKEIHALISSGEPDKTEIIEVIVVNLRGE